MDRLQSSGTGEACAEAQARMEQGKSQSRSFLHSAVKDMTAEGQSRAHSIFGVLARNIFILKGRPDWVQVNITRDSCNGRGAR